MGDDFGRSILYRRVYGSILDRLARVIKLETPEEIREAPLQGLAALDLGLADDPEVAETISEAVDDALFGRRPRW